MPVWTLESGGTLIIHLIIAAMEFPRLWKRGIIDWMRELAPLQK
jgi:hypothetical protein